MSLAADRDECLLPIAPNHRARALRSRYCALGMHGQTADTGAIAGTVDRLPWSAGTARSVVINSEGHVEKRDFADVSAPSTFGVISALTANPRIKQYALKVEF